MRAEGKCCLKMETERKIRKQAQARTTPMVDQIALSCYYNDMRICFVTVRNFIIIRYFSVPSDVVRHLNTKKILG